MNYVMLVCSEDAPVPADAATDADTDVEHWIERCGAARIYGEALAAPDRARTLRVRDGDAMVSDGPFIEAKEFIAGFDLLSCADLDEAIALAAAHPVAGWRMVELRPLATQTSLEGVARTLLGAEGTPGQRFLMLVSTDGMSGADGLRARLDRDSRAWVERNEANGTLLFSARLQGPETATTVRRRAGGTLLSDGPYVEAKEFLGGLCVLDCAGMEAALALAASFPVAAHHPVELRPFMVWED